MSGSGGGQSGDTTVNWNPSMQPRMDNYLNLMERSLFPAGTEGTYQDLSQFKPYTQQRYAPLNYNQQAAIANTGNFANLAPSPVSYTDVTGRQHQGSMNMATDQTQATLNGDYMPGGTKGDPFSLMNNPWTAMNPTVGTNDWASTNPLVQRNQYAGKSPYFDAMKSQGANDLINQYQQGTAADTTRMFNMAGAFGGSAHQNAMANNEAALGKTLANYDTQMDQGQYQNSANLEQQFLNSDLQNQQNNKALGGQWQENFLGRDLQNQQNNKQLGFQGQENFLNRGSGAYQAERGRQQGAAGQGYGEQGLALDRINALMGTGALQQGQDQKGLDFNYQQTQDANNWPFKLMQMLGGNYNAAMGNTSQTTQAYGGNNTGNILGALLGGYSML